MDTTTGLPTSRTRQTSRQIVSEATAEPPGESTCRTTARDVVVLRCGAQRRARSSRAPTWRPAAPRRVRPDTITPRASTRARWRRRRARTCGRRRGRQRSANSSSASAADPRLQGGIRLVAVAELVDQARRPAPRPPCAGRYRRAPGRGPASRPPPVGDRPDRVGEDRLGEPIEGGPVSLGEFGAQQPVSRVLELVSLLELRLDPQPVERAPDEGRLDSDPEQAQSAARLQPDLVEAGREHVRRPCRRSPRRNSPPRPAWACRSRRRLGPRGAVPAWPPTAARRRPSRSGRGRDGRRRPRAARAAWAAADDGRARGIVRAGRPRPASTGSSVRSSSSSTRRSLTRQQHALTVNGDPAWRSHSGSAGACSSKVSATELMQ